MDADGCNYNPAATDAGFCSYPSQGWLDCSGECNFDDDGDGICNELESEGCTNSAAFNYNPAATDDDGSCIAVALGCIDDEASNYDASANTDNGLCQYPGCTDSNALNYDADANVNDGSCILCNYWCDDCDEEITCSVCKTDGTYRHKEEVASSVGADAAYICPCDDGYYDDGTENAICQPCNWKCKTCDNAVTCGVCITEDREGDYCDCPKGTYDDVDAKICRDCLYECAACVNGYECTECIEGRDPAKLPTCGCYDGYYLSG
jgi:hypothetical protein